MSNMCVSKEGYAEAEAIRFEALAEAAQYKQLVAYAQIILNAKDAITSYKKLNDIASKSLALEEDLHNHIKDTYWPAEEQMLNEFTQPTQWDDQAVLAKRYAGRMWAPFASQFAKAMKKLECEKPRYCGNAYVKRLQELLVQRSATRANVTLLADRIAFFEVQAVRDTDFERRKQSIANRQGLLAQAASLMAQAQKGFAGMNANAMGAINNAIQMLGYSRTQQAQAERGFGADPYFHQQVAQRAAEQTTTPNITSFDDTVYSASIFNQSNPQFNATVNTTSSWSPYSGQSVNDDWAFSTGDTMSQSTTNSGLAPE